MRKHTRFYNIQKILLHYRRHTNQISEQKIELQHRTKDKIKIGLVEEILGNLSERESALYSDILRKTHSASTGYLSELYSLINKIISTNNRKKDYRPNLLNEEFQNIWKAVSKQCISKNPKVILFWMKMYPKKNSFNYYAYFVYLLLSRFRLAK
jgi:hypothetical protein